MLSQCFAKIMTILHTWCFSAIALRCALQFFKQMGSLASLLSLVSLNIFSNSVFRCHISKVTNPLKLSIENIPDQPNTSRLLIITSFLWLSTGHLVWHSKGQQRENTAGKGGVQNRASSV